MALSDCAHCLETPCHCGAKGYLVVYHPDLAKMAPGTRSTLQECLVRDLERHVSKFEAIRAYAKLLKKEGKL